MYLLELKESADSSMESKKTSWESKEEQHKIQVLHLNQTIAELKEKFASCEERVTELDSKNKTIVCELQVKKDLISTLEETVDNLKQEINRNKESIAGKVAQIKTFQSKLDDFKENEARTDSEAECLNLSDPDQSSSQISPTMAVRDSLVETMGSVRESTFYSAIEGLWSKCQEVLQESTKKNKEIHHLKKELEDLKNTMAGLQKEKDTLQVNLQAQDSVLKENEQLVTELRKQLQEATNDLERLKNQALDYKNESLLKSQQIKDLGLLVESYKEKCEKLSSLEDQTKEKSIAVLSLEKRLADLQAEHMNCEKNHQKLASEKRELDLKIKEVMEELSDAQDAKKEREKQNSETTKEIEL